MPLPGKVDIDKPKNIEQYVPETRGYPAGLRHPRVPEPSFAWCHPSSAVFGPVIFDNPRVLG